MKKPTLCVIFGGKSSEYEVSLRSAYAVLRHLDKEKYDIVRLGITKGGEWYIFEGENEEILKDEWHGRCVTPVTIDLSRGYFIALGKEEYALGVDLVLPILHGGYGEDGSIQGLLDIAGIPYAGCGAESSHICMDKYLTKLVAKALGVPVAKGRKINAKCKVQNAKLTTLPLFSMENATSPVQNEAEGVNGEEAKGHKMVVKPVASGSSVGVSIVENEQDLERALDVAFSYGDALIEEYIEGNEVEVGVLETGGEIVVSPVGMVKHGGKFYDYETKYFCGDNEYLIPAPIEVEIAKQIQGYTRLLFDGLGCRGFGRFDFFVKKGGGVVFNEVNTLPGFTDVSMFPKLFMSRGYSFSSLLDIIIEHSLRKKAKTGGNL